MNLRTFTYEAFTSLIVVRIFVLVVVLGMLTGCFSRKPLYSFSPYTKPDGSKGMQDSYADTTEEEASKLLSHYLNNAGLCPNGWYIEKSWATGYGNVTTREIKCN